jgi:hypothetical protein
LQALVPNLASDEFEPVNASWEGEPEATPAPQTGFAATLDASSSEEAEVASSFSETATIEVPDLRGRSLRTAIVDLSKLGLQLGAFGSGLVVEQSPAAASRVEPGSKILVKLSRQQ